MAAPTLRQGFSCLSRASGQWSRQPVLVTQSIAVVPVRTRKCFTPPIYEPKHKSEKELIDRARKAGVAVPPERLECIWPVRLVSLSPMFLQRVMLRCHLFQRKDWHRKLRDWRRMWHHNCQYGR